MKKADSIEKMLSKQQLLTIADLNATKINEMSEKQLQSYTKSLKSFMNIFPMQKGKLESAFAEKDYAMVLQWLKSIRDRLSQIHADNLARDCEKQINANEDISSIRHERLGHFIKFFFSTLMILFVDIQHMMEAHEANEAQGLDQMSQREKQAIKSVIIKQKLYTIKELERAKIELMSEAQLNNYIDDLAAFHENFQTQETGVRSSFKTKQYATILRWISLIEESLVKIHADSLIEDYINQLNLHNDISNIRHDKLEVNIDYLLSALSMFSEDIKALNLPKMK
ncbi:MAG: hypothetical protein FWE91_04660 [Defluviitaleaceae bacterium]|nr:hypothetical protein [Defluviitaleaceae bacterium]MCL2836990.1 hypothetical protein [Defluviitaleaceae bacterium]